MKTFKFWQVNRFLPSTTAQVAVKVPLVPTLTVPHRTVHLLPADWGHTTAALCFWWTWQESSHPWPNTPLWCCNNSHADVNLYTPRHQAIICDSSFQTTWGIQQLLKVFMLFDCLPNVDQAWDSKAQSGFSFPRNQHCSLEMEINIL